MRHTPGLVSLCLVTLAAVPAEAVTVTACDGLASVQAIAEPWEANTRTFANGEIRVVVLDTIEPAAAAFHLAILHPPRDELGSPMCSQVSASGRSGFGGMDIGPSTVSYDPARGLSVTINQSTGLVTAVVE